MENNIDFIITWVDGADTAWKTEKKKYQPDNKMDDGEERYRDWDNLKYWFRGVEKFAPWVRNIYFITWGHVPEWLNLEHPKLKVIKHTDYIPQEYLPTFNSHTIELNFHRIKGLSEHFVYFNDDMFLIKPSKKEDFSKNGLPRDRVVYNALCPMDETVSNIRYNNMRIINRYFNKRALEKKHLGKLFYPGYGFSLWKNIAMLPIRKFSSFEDDHIPITYVKSVFEELWNKEETWLHETCLRKFRSENDLSPWLFRYWLLAQGKVSPCATKRGKYFSIDSTNTVNEMIKRQKHQLICLNDTGGVYDFEEQKQKLIDAFQEILPEKSIFERIEHAK